MKKRLLQVAVVLVALFAVAQLIRPGRTNPPIDPSRAIAAHPGTPRALAAPVGAGGRAFAARQQHRMA